MLRSRAILISSTNHCPLSIVFAATNHLADMLQIAKACPTLRVIVSMDPMTPTEMSVLQAWASSVDVELLTLADMEVWGAQQGIWTEPGPLAGEEELDMKRVITISYTSGTTGKLDQFPKCRCDRGKADG